MTELARLTDADADGTAALGRALAWAAPPGGTLLLEGPLGAGKSHLARAFLRARLGDPAAEVPSPSFTLVQTYDDPAGGAMWHADLYRLAGAEEARELGLEDAAAGDLRLIEWPDRLAAPPPGALTVRLAPAADPERRDLTLSGDAAAWPGAARAAAIAGFLARAGWAGAELAPLAGDASARRYLRLAGPAGTAVLMDAPPGSCGPYLAMTDWLRARGFAAPAVLAADAPAGLLLLEDLGDDLLARVLARRPDLAAPAYLKLADLLADLARHPPAPGVPALDGPALAAQAGLFAEWYAPAAGIPARAAARIGPAIAALHAALCADTPPVTGLRDCHAENLVWQGEDAPLGLLDFQDAVAVHPAYDLVSALQDARSDVPAAVAAAATARFLALTGLDPARFAAAAALLGAQRQLRILGIFARLALRDGKTRYLDFLPRVWGHLAANLAHPALAPLAEALAGAAPPDAVLIARLTRAAAAPDAMMLFAAGRGTRMAPLTDRLPKPLIEVGGATLLDRALALAAEGGVRRTVVNIHHLAPLIAAHLAGRPGLALSDETELLLETGGGLRKALPLLPPGPVVTLNPDAVWTGPNPVAGLRLNWDGARMDALLMLVPVGRATAYRGSGDFDLDAEGRLRRGGPFVYGGAQILRPDGLAAIPAEVFSLNLLWDRMIAEGRAFGLVHDGGWCDVGRPDCLPLAAALLAGAAA